MLGDIVSVSGRPIHVTLAVLNNWSDNIKPIQLTHEILEKNGFGGNKPKVKLILEDTRELLYNIYEKELTIYWNSQVVFRSPCAYAHQLQHALKLCGIDKEIII